MNEKEKCAIITAILLFILGAYLLVISVFKGDWLMVVMGGFDMILAFITAYVNAFDMLRR